MKHICTIPVGSEAIAISSASAPLDDELRARFSRMDVVPCPLTMSVLISSAARGDYDDVNVRIVEDGDALALTTGGASGRFDIDAARLVVDVNDGDALRAAAAVENIIRPAFQARLLREKKGFVVHAGSAVIGGAAVLYPGVSNAGKTTLSRLLSAGGCSVFSDDLSVVLTGAPPRCVGSPFYGGNPGLPRTAGDAPLRQLLTLEQADVTELVSCSTASMARTLMSQIPFLDGLPRWAVGIALGLVNDVISAVPARRLRFAKDGDVLTLLAGALARR